MRTRFTWVVAILVLLAVGFLIACSTKYSSSNNGLIVVSTNTGSAVMDTFSLNLGNGSVAQINNVNGPPTPGAATAVVLDPAGAYAYVIVTQNSQIGDSVTGITTYSVASDGKLAVVGTTTLNDSAYPVAEAMDSAGKFLFVADLGGTVSVLSIGSGGSLSEVTGSPFPLPTESRGQSPIASALAVTPTLFPVLGTQDTSCAGFTPPTTENLYVTDSANYAVVNYSVSSSGALTLVPSTTLAPGIATGTVPSGVTVDPCNRFVFVSNQSPNNNVSAYKICSAKSALCQNADYSLQEVTGSPYAVGNGPGPLLVNPLGQFLYVLNTGSGTISTFKISSATGTLSPLTPATVSVNSFPQSIAIRSDDLWLFVTNLNSANVSEFALTPATGQLTPLTPITTDNYPWGIAVK
jgi:6-phosphogluconolactonase (cycloisomerase 2 family)